MILKRPTQRFHPLRHLPIPRGWRPLALWLSLPALLALTSLASIYYGMWLHETKAADSFATFFENVIETRLRVVPNWIEGQLRGEPERLTIDIKHKDFQKLVFKRQQAIERGLLLTSSDDFVPGKIRHGDRTLRVKLRLKGDWIDHLQGDKWSFRVRVRGDDTLFGLKEFSLHHPKTRNYISEWLYHRALDREGVISLRYRFVDVTLNGKPLGIYALEEHFEKRLVEHARRREGPILRLDENLHWLDLAAHGRKGPESPTGLQAQRTSFVDTFKTDSVLADPVQRRSFDTARTLLETFRAGKLPVTQVFDTKKLATYFAVSDLMGAEHGAIWFNLRFYYNPITSRLEPVGFDGNAGKRLVHPLGSSRPGDLDSPRVKDLCFADPDFYAEYVRALERVSDRGYLDTLLAEVGPELEANLAILYREFPWLHFSERVLRDNQQTIRSALTPTKGLHAHYAGVRDGKLDVELGNIQALPLEVLGVELDDAPAFEFDSPLVLPPGPPDARVEYVQAELRPVPGFEWAEERAGDLRVRYRVLGASTRRSDAIFPWSRLVGGLLEHDALRLESTVDDFDFLLLDVDTGTLLVRPGVWRIDRDLVIPPGLHVVAGSGTRLDLSQGAMILSRSPLDLRGGEEEPVVISSEDGTGQGLVVLSASGPSTLRRVVFRNLGEPSRPGWGLTGAVTFYESPVEIEGCELLSARAEDSLNVVRSSFRIAGTLFDGSASDAFDSDFSDGAIEGTAFANIGNDAIDVSGSEVEVLDVRVNGAGDKGLSAGEASILSAERVRIRGVSIGLASKDRSEVRGRDLHVEASKIGVAAFQKKPEFGPAAASLRQLEMVDVATPYLVEEGSQVAVDGGAIPASGSGLKALLYGVKSG